MLTKRFFLYSLVGILLLAGLVRFFRLESLPPSPYWEEVALGYDAYSIAKTGKDHHGNPIPIVAFESFGDWKPSGYFYALVPFIATLGLSTFTVRLPAALAGFGLVIVMGLLGFCLSQHFIVSNSKHKLLSPVVIGLLTAFLTAITPWAILFSRAAWEVNVATFLITLSVLVAFYYLSHLKTKHLSFKQHLLFLLGVAIPLVYSAYTYHATRVIAPLIGVGLVGLFLMEAQPQFNKLKRLITSSFIKALIVTGLISFSLFLPIVLQLNQPQLKQRFKETAITEDLEVIEQTNYFRELNQNSVASRVFFHRYLSFGQSFFSNAVSHLNPNFLFISGDGNPRHSTQYFGQLYHLDAVFLLLGVVYLIRKRNRYGLFLLGWFIVGMIPVSLTKAVPHALRTLPILPVLLLTSVFGIVQLGELMESWFKKKSISSIVVTSLVVTSVLLYSIEFIFFWRNYTTMYLSVYAPEWQYGYGEAISQVQRLQKAYPDLPVYMTRSQGRPAMYYWFYTKTDPSVVQALNDSVPKDQGEYLQFNQLKFFTSLSEIENQPAILAVSRDEFKKLEQAREVTKIEQIKDPLGNIVWIIAIQGLNNRYLEADAL